ncbi:MAG: WbqC family protein [Bacteroidales bacterium]|nr:WbqC family protein [Bacteroidales bacterium]
MTDKRKAIFSTAYFPPINYISEILKCETIIIERFENYSKQSYRNRCEILSPNGKLALSVPIVKTVKPKQLIKDVKIDYKNNWQALHLKSLKTAYLSSPFFEFYIDAFLSFFEKKYTFLFDYNIEILQKLFSELEINKKIIFTEEYYTEYFLPDFRNSIHPKKQLQQSENKTYSKKYTQVFFNKFDFISDLSILDLLFNEGPNAVEICNNFISD